MAGEGTEPTGTSTRGVERTGTSTRGKGRSQPVEGHAKNEEAKAIERFMILLEGPPNRSSAPPTLTLPQVLFKDMMRQIQAAFEDGLEHAGLFGYHSSRSKYGIVFGTGEVDKMDYSKGYSDAAQLQPPLTIVGVFHTHLFAFFDPEETDLMGWQGGGPSSSDLINFFTRPARASAIISYTKDGKRKIYFLLRPKIFNVKSPKNIAKGYAESVIKLVGKEGDPDDVSEKELLKLAKDLGFVFYTSLDSPELKKK